jgi:hypothetical protein
MISLEKTPLTNRAKACTNGAKRGDLRAVLLYQSRCFLRLAAGSRVLQNPINNRRVGTHDYKMWDVPHLKCRFKTFQTGKF